MPITPVVRTTPTGAKLKDGYQSKIAMENVPGINLWEISIKPGAKNAGDPIETTTMYNDTCHTKAPQSIYDEDEDNLVCAYDPAVEDDIDAQLGVEQAFTRYYPNGDKYTFYGYLRLFDKQELVRGTFPVANVSIVHTNADPTTGAEVPGEFTAASGT